MLSYLLLILIIGPFIGAAAIAFFHSHSLLSPLLVLVGMMVGAITILFSGFAWLQSLHSEWMQSQAVGFILIPAILPFYAYLGAVSGASLVPMLYGYSKDQEISGWFIVAAVALTIIVTGFIPAAVLTTQSIDANGSGVSTRENEVFLILLPIVTAAIGTASAWLSSAFTFWVFSLCRLLR
ncbi:MAG: hypothetical protein HLUCCA11_23775 [Phormidesmis priestleyi Ana]|uniref:Uncharacterized protein n=1 Tax=Phormidesmis priestleyi Ana TaxID=1666911 RepID=A0A0P7ZPC5_9CYAN|nr:MAG: hypothetical protein HLUCCA11_23775 [Phormidesmis priestleyi Ana]